VKLDIYNITDKSSTTRHRPEHNTHFSKYPACNGLSPLPLGCMAL